MHFKEYMSRFLKRPDNVIAARILTAALVVVSFVVILDHYSWLEDLKINVMKLAVPAIFLESPELPETYEYRDKSGSAMVFTINDSLYEENFGQVSPLYRKELYSIIDSILKNEPKVLAIDFDLSPGPVNKMNSANWAEAQEMLDELLMKSAGETNIVLITPVKVRTTGLIQKKIEWMRKICDANINFGLPYLYSRQGVVLKYFDNPNTFAWQVASAGSEKAHKEQYKTICEYTDEGLKQFVNTRMDFDASAGDKLLNFKFTDYIEPMGRAKVEIINKVGRELAGKVVFLGGTYGATDKYETPIGVFAGVYLHGAGFFSISNPIGNSLPILKYLFEIVVCALLGLLFYWMAGWYRESPTSFAILANMGLPVFLFITLSKVAGYVFVFTNTWFNPAILIIGMELFAQFGGLEEPVKEDTNISDFKHSLKWIFFGLIVCYAWWLIFFEVFLS